MGRVTRSYQINTLHTQKIGTGLSRRQVLLQLCAAVQHHQLMASRYGHERFATCGRRSVAEPFILQACGQQFALHGIRHIETRQVLRRQLQYLFLWATFYGQQWLDR